ncbi:MAG: hypothetical protein HKP51_03695 [Sulfitobacter sp.]|nr:hypothetical protein [Sulfitobacter sp.]
MNITLILLVTTLLLWMAACAICGYRGRFVGFLGVLLAGLTLNMVWMVYGLQAHPLETNALIAQGAASLYAVCAFSIGWFAARIRRAWRDSRIL